jgi:hypothetical protein
MSVPIWILRMTAHQIWQSIRKRGTSCWISSITVWFPSSVPAKLLYFSQMYHQTQSRIKCDNKHDSQSLKREIRSIMQIAFFIPTMLFSYYSHPPPLFVAWHVEKTRLIVNEHMSLWEDGKGYKDKRFNLPGPSWTTVCPWSQLGNLSNWLQ